MANAGAIRGCGERRCRARPERAAAASSSAKPPTRGDLESAVARRVVDHEDRAVVVPCGLAGLRGPHDALRHRDGLYGPGRRGVCRRVLRPSSLLLREACSARDDTVSVFWRTYSRCSRRCMRSTSPGDSFGPAGSQALPLSASVPGAYDPRLPVQQKTFNISCRNTHVINVKSYPIVPNTL